MSDLVGKPGQFFCSHCGTENPEYDFVHNAGGNAQMRVVYLTVVCKGTVTPRPCAVCHGVGTVPKISGMNMVVTHETCPGCRGEKREPYICKRILSVCVLACEISRLPVVGG